MTERDARDEVIETISNALAAAHDELWQTYGDTKRVQPLFEQIGAAGEALALLRAPETQDGPSRDFLLAENARLKAALKARAETQERGWQDIATAPKDGTDVLLFWPMESERPVVGRWCARSKGHWYSDVSECQSEFTPTHWMPLPSPPAQTEDSQ